MIDCCVHSGALREVCLHCAWQLARQRPGSEIFRALAACLDSEAGRGVLAKDLARPYIAPQGRNGLVACLLHEDELADAVHGGLGHAARPERVPAELLDLQSRPAGCALEELADRISSERRNPPANPTSTRATSRSPSRSSRRAAMIRRMSAERSGAFPCCAVPIVRRMPLRVSPTTKWRVLAGESVKPAAWWALVIDVSRRAMVPDAKVDARSAM